MLPILAEWKTPKDSTLIFVHDKVNQMSSEFMSI